MQMFSKKIHRTLAVLLLFLLLFLTACGEKQPGDTAGGEQGGTNPSGEAQALTLTLPYFEKDSLNPYFAASAQNRDLSALYCQPLFEVTAAYAAQPVLADSCSFDENTMTVTLKSATFSDGSALSADDVVYSFTLAKASSWYATRLASVTAARARKGAVVFTLSSPDKLAANLLTFPIVKRKTADKTDEIPVGTGAFVLAADRTLSPNTHGSQGNVQSVSLFSIKDVSYLKNALEIGSISYLFSDFSSGSYTRVVAENKFITMNNLVYIGMNANTGALSNAAVRTAVYYAADKAAVASAAYQGCATAVGLPFHPNYLAAQNLSVGQTEADTDRALEILQKSGYNRYDKNSVRTNGTETLKMTVLVNSENSFRVSAAQSVADNLNACGFSVTVESVPAAEYQSRVASGNFTLYIGEVKLPENLDLSAFYAAGGSASAGINKTLPFWQTFQSFRAGERNAEQVSAAFLDDMPFVPLCYRAGMAAYSKGLAPDFSLAAYAMYGNITRWSTAQS